MILLLLLALGGTPVHAQQGFTLPSGVRKLEIPFEYVNNFIILTVAFNGPLPLKFIYDTGAEYTILTKREISDLLQVQYDREFRVKGADMKTDLVAYLARNIRLQVVGKEMVHSYEDILILKEDYFRFEEYAGVDVQGILAGRVFARYLVKINYQRKILTLYKRDFYRPKSHGYDAMSVEVFRNKMYVRTNVQLNPDSTAKVKLLLDTGAGMPLMLFDNTHPLIHLPANAVPANIGMGLGGYLEGYVGRVSGMNLAGFNHQNVVTYFQTLDTSQDLTYLYGRNGLIGNSVLNRFQIVLDYAGEIVWLKPNKYFKKEFVYDRSGLSIIASGQHLNYFTILNVLSGSPADEAGILAGDRLIRVGWLSVTFRTLSEIQSILQKKPGKKIRIVVKRNGKIIKKWLVLRELI